jgi:hypothetical protein
LYERLAENHIFLVIWCAQKLGHASRRLQGNLAGKVAHVSDTLAIMRSLQTTATKVQAAAGIHPYFPCLQKKFCLQFWSPKQNIFGGSALTSKACNPAGKEVELCRDCLVALILLCTDGQLDKGIMVF